MIAGNALVLTKEGWRDISLLKKGDEVATLDVGTDMLVYQKIESVQSKHHQGLAYKFHGKNFALTAMPDHRFLLEDRRGLRFYRTAAQLFEKRDNKWKVIKKCIWNGEDSDYFLIPEAETKTITHDWFKEKCSEPLIIDSEDWFAFMGWWLSEGHVAGSDGQDYKSRRNYSAFIHQRKKETVAEILALYERLPIQKSMYGSKTITFRFCDLRLHSYLKPLGNSHEKYIPSELKNASPHLLKIMFDAFMKGDGRNVAQGDNGQYSKMSVFSTSQRLILDMQEVLLKMGGCGNISEWQPKDRVIFENSDLEVENGSGEVEVLSVRTKREIKSINSKLQYNLNVSSTEFIYLDKRMMTVDPVAYDDQLYDLKVPNGNYYVMVNGKAYWTGGLE